VDGRSRRIQPRWGGITAPTDIGRGRVAERSNGPRIFLTSGQLFLAGIRPKLLRGGAMGFANGRLVRRHGGTRRVQVPGRGNVLTNLDFFSGRGARNRGNRRRRGDDGGDGRKGIRFASAEQVIAAGGTEIAGCFHQDRAHFARFQCRIALQHQGCEAADICRGKRGAGRHLVLFIGRRQEDIDARGSDRDMAAAVRCRKQLVLRIGGADRNHVCIGGGI